jgi:hypothetical protein
VKFLRNWVAAKADPDLAPAALRRLAGATSRELGPLSARNGERVLGEVAELFGAAVEMACGETPVVRPIDSASADRLERLVRLFYAEVNATWPECFSPDMVGELLALELADVVGGRATLAEAA